MAEEWKFSWLTAIWKGILPILITAGITVGLDLLNLFQAQIDAGGLKLGFFTSFVVGLVNIAKNFLKNYGK